MLRLVGCCILFPFLLHAQSLTWNSIGGVPGCFVIKEGANGRLFTANDGNSGGGNGVVFTSSDEGISWTETAINYGFITELAANNHYVIASRIVNARFPYQTYLSTNDGTTWNAIVASTSQPYQYFMISDAGVPFAMSDGSVVRFDGFRWRTFGNAVIPGGDFPTLTAIDHFNNLYVGSGSNGLFTSRDSGVTWNSLLAPHGINCCLVDSFPKIVVGASTNLYAGGGVFLSLDSGKTWTTLGFVGSDVNALSYDTGNTLYAVTSTGVYRYNGTPGDWASISPSSNTFQDVRATPSHAVLAASASGGVFRSTDQGTTWTKSGIRSQEIDAVVSSDSGKLYVGTLGQGIFSSVNGGLTWSQTPPGTVCDNIFSLLNLGSTIFAGTYCGMYRTTDNGYNWSQVSNGFFSGSALCLGSQSDGKIFAGTDFGVYSSPDSGTTWKNSGLQSSKIISLAVTSTEIVAASATDGIFASSDQGGTWNSLGLQRDDIQTVGEDYTGEIYVGVNGGVITSADHGATWTSHAFVQGYVYGISFAGNTVVAATNIGPYVSSNQGQAWSSQKNGMSDLFTLAIYLDQRGTLYAGTYGGGLYKSNQTVSAVIADRTVPRATKLMQNYPNPFNPVTEIRYDVAKTGVVTISIYDVLGRKIATLVHQLEQPGEHAVAWDASNAGSGIYFYEMEIAGYKEVKKMLVMK